MIVQTADGFDRKINNRTIPFARWNDDSDCGWVKTATDRIIIGGYKAWDAEVYAQAAAQNIPVD